MLVGSSLGPMSSPPMIYWTDLLTQGCVLLCGMGLKYNHKVAGYFYNICATIVTHEYINPQSQFSVISRLTTWYWIVY